MALQGSCTTDDGVEHAQAYCKVVEINSNWQDKSAHITIEIFHDKAARDAGKTPLSNSRSYDLKKEAKQAITRELENGDVHVMEQTIPAFDELFSVAVLSESGKNAVSQAYAWLKTRTEWQNWLDV